MTNIFDDASFWWNLWFKVRASKLSEPLSKNTGFEVRAPIDGRIVKLRTSGRFTYDNNRPGNYQEDFPGGFVGYQLCTNSYYIPAKMRFTAVYSQSVPRRFDCDKFYDKHLVLLNKTSVEEIEHILMMMKMHLYA